MTQKSQPIDNCDLGMSRCMRTMSSGPTRGDGSSISDGGSGGGGSIKAAGGKFAERESALENEYFYKLVRIFTLITLITLSCY